MTCYYRINMNQNSPFNLFHVSLLWHNVLTISLTLHDILCPFIIHNTNYIGSCVANEAMLTGESVPQIKESLALVDRELITDIKSGKPMHDLLLWYYVICRVLVQMQFLWLPLLHKLFDFFKSLISCFILSFFVYKQVILILRWLPLLLYVYVWGLECLQFVDI